MFRVGIGGGNNSGQFEIVLLQKIFSVGNEIAKEVGEGFQIGPKVLEGGDDDPAGQEPDGLLGFEGTVDGVDDPEDGDGAEGVETVDQVVLQRVVLVLMSDVEDVVKMQGAGFALSSLFELSDDFRAAENPGGGERSGPFPIILVKACVEVDGGVGEDDGGAKAKLAMLPKREFVESLLERNV